MFEYRAKPDEIIHLDSGEREKAWRIQYRRPGSRRWTRFLLVQPTLPDAATTEALLIAHEKRASS